VQGCDLRHHLNERKTLTEIEAKFLIICIIIGLEYMHNNGVLHRDIKPENLLIDQTGYIRITDMGISKMWKPENANDTSGTPGYMAPEVICRQNHGYAVDYFALGIILYEFMFGCRPYTGRNRQEIKEKMFDKQICIKRSQIPEGWSIEAADFVNKLL
jgi:serine/threonine protein kinase